MKFRNTDCFIVFEQSNKKEKKIEVQEANKPLPAGSVILAVFNFSEDNIVTTGVDSRSLSLYVKDVLLPAMNEECWASNETEQDILFYRMSLIKEYFPLS